jgi:hypothetical protein
MFWDAPEGYEPTEAERDMHARLTPDPDVQARAVRALAGTTGKLAVIPMALPGKTRGFWTTGQPVHTLPAFWLTAEQTLHTYTDAADLAARGWLNHAGEDGTTAYALVTPDDHAAVFEGFR